MLATWGTSTGFNPSSLFAGGVQGAWYDPSDNTTMFQDAAGTTSVTAVEQAVGLILDKRNGLGIGTEVISNNTFDSDTVWTKGTGWSIGSGVATKTAGSAANLSQTVTLVAGTTYRLVYTITRTAGSITPQFTGGTTVSGTARSAAGTYVENITAVTGNTDFQFAADASFAGTVDNVYLKRVSGNDAFQTTSASRPTLRARYNLLTYSEDQSNAAWINYAATQVSNVATAPDGTLTADRIVEAAGSSLQARYVSIASQLNVPVTASIYAKASERNFINVSVSGTGTANWFAATFNVANGTVTQTGAGASGTYTSSSITSVGDGWYRCVVTGQVGQAGSNYLYVGPSDSGTPTYGSFGVLTYAGNTANGILVWGAQFTNPAVFPSNVYQRIAAATVYDTGAAFPQYLAFDGTDDSLLTANVDFSGTDKMTVFSGVSKLSDAAGGTVIKTASETATFGYVTLRAPRSAAANYGLFSTGTLGADNSSAASFAAPITNVVTGICDIANDLCDLRINTVLDTDRDDQGTGNYGNYAMYIGRLSSGSLPFNGRIYSLIVRGAASNTTQVEQTERYVASKTPLGVVP